MVFPFGLYGSGMHDFVLREAEVGTRVAVCEDNEQCGWGALEDLSFEIWAEQEREQGNGSTDHHGVSNGGG